MTGKETIKYIAITLVGLVMLTVIGVTLTNAGKYYLDEEAKQCERLVMGEAEKYGYFGQCDTYIGADHKLHYYYTRYTDARDYDGKDIYINWETGKAGKY